MSDERSPLSPGDHQILARSLQLFEMRFSKWRRPTVEAAHSWTNRFRDLLIRWSKKKPDDDLAFTHFAFGIIAWRQCLPG